MVGLHWECGCRGGPGQGGFLPTDLPTSTVFARAPPLALARRLPLEDEEPRESEEELLMLSLSCPRPQEVGAQPPRSGLRLKVGELSDVVSGALLSMLAMPDHPQDKSLLESGIPEVRIQPSGISFPPCYLIDRRTCVLFFGPPRRAPAPSIVASTTAKCQTAGNLPLRPWSQSCLRRKTLTGRMWRAF
jgi:hypothetical protein